MRWLPCLLACQALFAQGELRFNLRHEPKTLNPILAAEDASQAIAYLTGGVLIRVNRLTQELQPELAESWKVAPDNRSIVIHIRKGVRFSDGTPFTAEDVAWTLQTATDPKLHSPAGESFSAKGSPARGQVLGPDAVSIVFAAPVASLERLFDQLPILSSKSPLKEKAALGPFMVASYQPGIEVVLRRNPNYWKKDASGKQLPYLDAVRLPIQQNREIEFARFSRGEIHLINQLEPELFDRLKKANPEAAFDAGPSTDVDFLWFNQVAGASIPDYKKDWFRSRNFRNAISRAINREDLCRVVFRGRGRPAVGPFSPANKFWFNAKLTPSRFDPTAALKLLQQDGFSRKGDVLFDKQGHAVEFSVITNAGNRIRERMAVLIQQDLQAIGVKLNIVTLDFPSLIERITKTFQYESCLLGLTNVDLDPNEMMNIWMSSSEDHGWNPSQKTPATPWEAEIDNLMRAQSAAGERLKRKALFDRVQEILRQEEPYIYLAHRNSLSAVSPSLRGVHPAALFPQTYWDIEHLSLK
ncbi:MAG: extracellular solute-binding protein family 5 [Bryobacterales bacterium]|nr:extracellular solute-binding protein family 5 [Bryobacterales bacterium]